MIWALVRKEGLEDLCAVRSVGLLVVAGVVLSAFSILCVANTELSLLDNAQAVYFMTSIVLALASLVAIVRASDGFAGERERETLEILMLTPATGPQLAAAKLFGILVIWGILFAIAAPYLWAVGQNSGNFLAALRYLWITGTLLVITLSSLALALSAKVKSFRSVLSVGLTTVLLLASPVLLGPSLRQNAAGQVMDIINPFANAVNILDSVVIDAQGVGFQGIRLATMLAWSVLGVWMLHATAKKMQI